MKSIITVILGGLAGVLFYKTVNDLQRWEALMVAHKCKEVTKDRMVCANGRTYRR